MLKRSVPVVAAALMSFACGSRQAVVQANAPDAKTVSVSTATAITREVPADFEETGSFVADESSDIAPPVAGRVISTPVNVGDHVKTGQVICELDHRDAELKLEQARAQYAEATASVRQARSRIGLSDSAFDPRLYKSKCHALVFYQDKRASLWI